MAELPDFGTTLSCVNDFASDARMVSGFAVVGEAVARRWFTPRGRLIGFPNYGFYLPDYINADMSPRDIAALRAGAAAEAEKDPRVDKCTVRAVLGRDGTLTLEARIDTAQGPFQLVVAATSVTVDLISITPIDPGT